MKLVCFLFTVSLLFILSGCSNDRSVSNPDNPLPKEYTAFDNPELVTITDYSGDVMEPFISRDGTHLFFNNRDGPTKKDIFYATFVDETTFEFQGALTTINTTEVDGVPTMDAANNFYYISTSGYNPPTSFGTIYKGTWYDGTIIDAASLTGLAKTQPGIVNFDVEVSSDGSTLYFDDGDFRNGNNFPRSADIVIAIKSGSSFVRDPNSSFIMANVNTENLEYAPAISADGLEFFFTRLDLEKMKTGIYRAERENGGAQFDAPQLVSTINGFVEGPTLSPDEKSLYYHRRNTDTGLFELYRVTRP